MILQIETAPVSTRGHIMRYFIRAGCFFNPDNNSVENYMLVIYNAKSDN